MNKSAHLPLMTLLILMIFLGPSSSIHTSQNTGIQVCNALISKGNKNETQIPNPGY